MEGVASAELGEEGVASAELSEEGAASAELSEEGVASAELSEEGVASAEFGEEGVGSARLGPIGKKLGIAQEEDVGIRELRMLAEVVAVQRSGLGDGADVSDRALGEDVVGDEASPVQKLRRKSKHEHTPRERWVLAKMRILVSAHNLKD